MLRRSRSALYITSPNYTPSRRRVTETPLLAASGGAGRGVSVMPDRAPAARAGVSVAFPPRTAEFRQLWADRPISDDRNSASRATPCREDVSFGHARAIACHESRSFGDPRDPSGSPSTPSPSGSRGRPRGSRDHVAPRPPRAASQLRVCVLHRYVGMTKVYVMLLGAGHRNRKGEHCHE